MVVSGLHIGLCAMVGYGLTYLLVAFDQPGFKAGLPGASPAYWALAGFSLPTAAGTGDASGIFLRGCYRETSSFQVLLLALAAVLLLHPLVIDTGFWLSLQPWLCCWCLHDAGPEMSLRCD